MKKLLIGALVALCLSAVASAGATTSEWRVKLLKGTALYDVDENHGVYAGASEAEAWAKCLAAIPASVTEAAQYTCQTPRYVRVMEPDAPPPPSCTTPKPADDTQTIQCVVPQTGSWQQSRFYSPTDYPACWQASAWSPSDAPPGSCQDPPPPAVDCVVSDPVVTTGAWTPSTCPASGQQTRTVTSTRTVVTPPANGGAACPVLVTSGTEQQSCTPPVDPPPTGQVITVQTGGSISAAVAQLQPGGTVVIKPGNYSAITTLKACTPAAYCTIKAETDGTVNVAGLSIGPGNWYTSLEGLKITGNASKDFLGSFLKVKRTAIQGGPANGNEVTVQIGTNDRTPGATDILFEDVWVYGAGGRYKVLVYNSKNVVLRRVVVRHDGGWTFDGSDPQGGFSLYDSINVVCEDCLFVDSVQNLTDFEAALYLVSNSTTSQRQANVSVLGAVLVGSPNNGLAAEGNGSVATYTINDVAVVGSVAGGFNTNNKAHVLNIARSLAKVSGYQYARWASSGSVKVNPCATGSGPISSGASLTNCPGGEGPRLTFRVGLDGTMYGETGYTDVTAVKLWPWPNEARIKADFDSVRPAFNGQSLTEYVWSKIGQPVP